MITMPRVVDVFFWMIISVQIFVFLFLCYRDCNGLFINHEEERIIREVVEAIEKFKEEDDKHNWGIYWEKIYPGALFFTMHRSIKKEDDIFVGLAVEILDMDKYQKKFPIHELDYICENYEWKNGDHKIIFETLKRKSMSDTLCSKLPKDYANCEKRNRNKGRSFINVLEKTPDYIVYEWKDKGDLDDLPTHALVKIEIVGNKLIFKKFINEKRLLTEEEMQKWRNRFEEIPVVLKTEMLVDDTRSFSKYQNIDNIY